MSWTIETSHHPLIKYNQIYFFIFWCCIRKVSQSFLSTDLNTLKPTLRTKTLLSHFWSISTTPFIFLLWLPHICLWTKFVGLLTVLWKRIMIMPQISLWHNLNARFAGPRVWKKTLKCGEMEMIFIQDTCLRFGLNMPYFIFKINVTAPNIPWVKHKNGLR